MEHICTSASSNLDEALNLDAYLADNATRVREFRVNWRLEELQFKEPAGTSRGVMRTRKVWYVELNCIIDDNCYTGIGECAPLPGLSCDNCADYENILSDACQQWQKQRRVPSSELIDYPSILMGFETAERSLLGDLAGIGPYALWHSSFLETDEGIRINGLVWMGTAEEMQARMDAKLRMGFSCVKLKIGAIDFERELDLIKRLRERYSVERVELRLDANGAFPVEEAFERLRRLAPYDIHSIEQPIRPGQWDAMANLCRTSPIPIALDEELIGVNRINDKICLLDVVQPQYIILKPSLHGGFSGCKEWETLADERSIALWYTSALESNVGLNAIAQWTSRYQFNDSVSLRGNESKKTAHDLTLPQGLGTGQLFVTNYASLPLYVEGERLYLRSKQERFERVVDEFREIWENDQIEELLLKTSGSTGSPQVICATKAQLRASANRTISALNLPEGTRALLCLPIVYIAGKMILVRAWEGKWELQCVAPSLHPFADLSESPDFVALTPAQAVATYDVPAERSLLQQTGCVLLGGGKIDETLECKLQSCQGRVWSSYGMTETLSHIALRRINGEQKSQGYYPMSGVSVKINTEGCLVIDDLALGIKGLITHDLAQIAPDGSFTILGRTDNVINSGGVKLHLEALEEQLAALPFRFVLTSVPDVVLGEALTLLLEESPLARTWCGVDEEEVSTQVDLSESTLLLSFLRAKLTSHSMPKKVFVVEQIPFTASGKPARSRIKALAARCLSHEKEGIKRS